MHDRQSSAPRGQSPLERWRLQERKTKAEAGKLFNISATQYGRIAERRCLPRRELLERISVVTGRPHLGAAIVMHWFGVTTDDAAWYFKLTEAI